MIVLCCQGALRVVVEEKEAEVSVVEAAGAVVEVTPPVVAEELVAPPLVGLASVLLVSVLDERADATTALDGRSLTSASAALTAM